MKRLYGSALVAMAIAVGTGLPDGAQAEITVSIAGFNENSEASCSQATVIIVNADCTYSGQRPSAFYGWIGPSFVGGYYEVGSIGDNFAYVPVPGDGKIRPTISGSLVFTGSGAGATIGGTFIMGPAVRNTVVGNLTRGVERWTAITHTLASTAVTTAAPNAGGGFDYVIGVNGRPGTMCLTADPALCFPLETGPDPVLTDFQNVWNNGVPPLVGIEGTTLNGGAVPNIGATTSAVISDYSSSCAVPTDCTNGLVVWQGSGSPAAESAGWDNLVLAISTDGAGNITSGEAWWIQEYQINLGPPPRSTNSWIASRFTFTGAAEGAAASCADFSASILGGSASNEIDARSRCTGFDPTPAISIVTGPANGTAAVNGAGNIVYTPNGGFSGTDTLTYNGSDGARNDDGLLTLTVSADPVPAIADGSIDTGVTDTLALTVTLGNGSATQHTLTVTADGSNGACTTGTEGGFIVTYTPNAGFAGQDACTLTLTDANADSDTALISISVPDELVTVIDGGGSATDPLSLLLLGAVAAFWRRRGKQFRHGLTLAVLLVLGANPLLADEWNREGAYVGVGAIGTDLQSDSPAALTGQLDASVAGTFTDFPAGGEVYAGWLWNRDSGIELRYGDSGDGDSRLQLRSVVTGDVTDIGEIQAGIQGYTVYLVRQVPYLPLPDRWSVYGKAGWTWQDLDASFQSSGASGFPASGSASDSDSGAALALGLRWHFARRWALAAEGELLWVNFDDSFDEPWRIGLSVGYWFGGGKAED